MPPSNTSRPWATPYTWIAVFSSEALERANVLSVDELSKLTTGLTFDTDFGRLSDRPILRRRRD